MVSHSPCRCLLYTLQSDVGFFGWFFLENNFHEVATFLYSHFPTRF